MSGIRSRHSASGQAELRFARAELRRHPELEKVCDESKRFDYEIPVVATPGLRASSDSPEPKQNHRRSRCLQLRAQTFRCLCDKRARRPNQSGSERAARETTAK